MPVDFRNTLHTNLVRVNIRKYRKYALVCKGYYGINIGNVNGIYYRLKVCISIYSDYS
jgi:hypothetical protein